MTKTEIAKLKSKVIDFGKQGKYAAQIEHLGICSRQTAVKYLKEVGLYVDNRGGKNAKIKDNPFICRSPEADYWLGMLIADGWIDTRKHSIGLKQGGINKKHMLKYRKFLSNDVTLHESRDKKQYTILFGHKPTSNWLINTVGVIPNKSNIIELKIPFNWDIVRGYFDGDGGFNKIKIKNKKLYINLKFTSGSLVLLQQLQRFLTSEGVISRLFSESTTVHRLSVSGNSRFIFCDKLYKNALVYMERKKQIWDSYAQEKFGELLGTPEKDNQQPSLGNGIKVSKKVQRLEDEEPTNNSSTSAERYNIQKYDGIKVKNPKGLTSCLPDNYYNDDIV
jgi:hypothetical protein